MTDSNEYDVAKDELAKEVGPGHWLRSKFRDSLGRELEAHRCEYCGKVKPVKVWNGFQTGRESYNILMVEYLRCNERKMWRCIECSTDIKNKLEGK